MHFDQSVVMIFNSVKLERRLDVLAEAQRQARQRVF